MPAGDTELELSFSGGDNFFVSMSPEGNIYLYIEVDVDDTLYGINEGAEHAMFRSFETGEAVDGCYVGSVSDGRVAKHIYWTNFMESDRYDATRRDIRNAESMPEVPASGGSNTGDGTSGSSEDVQHYLPE